MDAPQTLEQLRLLDSGFQCGCQNGVSPFGWIAGSNRSPRGTENRGSS
jgi:hypothetical protein